MWVPICTLTPSTKQIRGCISQGSPEKQSQRNRDRCIARDFLQGQARGIRKAAKSRDLPSASWTPRRAGSSLTPRAPEPGALELHLPGSSTFCPVPPLLPGTARGARPCTGSAQLRRAVPSFLQDPNTTRDRCPLDTVGTHSVPGTELRPGPSYEGQTLSHKFCFTDEETEAWR